MPIDTVFLDAGGVLVFPNWDRVAEALGRHGITTTGAALAAVEWHAKHEVDTGAAGQSDLVRGWLVFGRVFARAGLMGDHAGAFAMRQAGERRTPTGTTVDPSIAAASGPTSTATSDATSRPTIAPAIDPTIGAGIDPATAAAIDRALGDLQQYHADFNLWERVPDDVIPALRRMRAAGTKLVVVSNANGRMRDALGRVGIGPHVDLVVDSFEEGVEKPDPRIFVRALERIGSRAETTLHVGDLFHTDVVGARAAGLRPVLLDMADLYADHDCERVHSLTALADLVAAERGN